MKRVIDKEQNKIGKVKWKVGNKLIVIMLGVAIVPLFFSGYLSFTSARDILVEGTISELAGEAKQHAAEISLVLNGFSNDVIFLAHTPPLQGIIRARKNDGFDELGDSTEEVWINRLQTIFEGLAKSNSNYLQIRYLDESGQEIVRINSDSSGVHIAQEEELQNKFDRYYFSETITLANGELFISELDLNREGSPPEIEVPHKPVIRYGTPVIDDTTGDQKGMVIINVKAESFLQTLHNKFEQSGGKEEEFLVDKDGYYFLHTDKEKEWGGPNNLDTGENIKGDMPAEIVLNILSGGSGAQTIGDGSDVLAYHPIFPNADDIDLFWVIFEIIPEEEVLASIANLRNILFGATISFGFIAVLLAFIFSRSVSKPIILLTKMATALTSGDMSARSAIDTNDEFGILSKSFNKMAKTIENSRATLEEKVKIRTAELNEGKDELLRQQHAVLNILEDIQEERDKLDQQVNETQKFKLAVETVSDHVVITDADGIIVYANNSVGVITGYDPKEIIGKKAGGKDTWGGHMSEEFYKEMWHTIKEKKEVFIGEINNKRKNGEDYTAFTSIAPIIGEDGEIIFFVGIERDVSEERKIDRAKTEFVSLASHQLRTPLSAINWYSEMLLDGDAGDVSEQQRTYMQEIYNGNQRMVKLVNSLLNVSRLELGTFTVEPEPTNIVKMARNLVQKELKQQIDKKKLSVNIHEEGEIPVMRLDANLTGIMVQNLLSNAIKYTPEGGSVDVFFANLKAGKEYGHKTFDKDMVIFSVVDTGYGIPEAQKDKIFTKLFRADNIRSLDTEGTGLGLYVIKSIVDNISGEVWFESVEGKGSTFYIAISTLGMEKKEGSRKLS